MYLPFSDRPKYDATEKKHEWLDYVAGASQCQETPVASLVLYAICIHIFQQILHISPNYLRSSSKLVESCLVIAPLMPKYTTNKLP